MEGFSTLRLWACRDAETGGAAWAIPDPMSSTLSAKILWIAFIVIDLRWVDSSALMEQQILDL